MHACKSVLYLFAISGGRREKVRRKKKHHRLDLFFFVFLDKDVNKKLMKRMKYKSG